MIHSTYNIDFLKKNNTHIRDQYISFYEPTHTYTILNDPKSKYTSVTTLIHTLFEQFNADNIIHKMMLSKKWPLNKYFGMSSQEIKNLWEINRVNAANMGTHLHYLIECFMNLGQFISNNHNNTHSYNLGQLLQYYFTNPRCLDVCKNNDFIVDNDFIYFINFAQKFPNLIPFRTEWTIYDEDLKLSGSIDMLFKDEHGKFHIYDWKRSKEIVKTKSWLQFSTSDKISHIPDTNYWHYCLQLNTYKLILKNKYDIDIETMYLVCLHPDNKNHNFILFKVSDLQAELNSLFSE
jgi:hypothetical protein